MNNAAEILDENWQVLTSAFPSNWEELAMQTGAVKELGDFKSVNDILRVLLMHVGRGLSLRETAAHAKLSDIADVSDVAILKRFKNAEAWFYKLCLGVVAEAGIELPRIPLGLNLRLVDATVIKEQGKTGSQWRLHYSLKLPDLTCDAFELTPTSGEGSAETFIRYPINRGDYIIGDSAYSKTKGIQHVHESGAYSLVRLHHSSMPLYSSDGTRFDTLAFVKQIKEPLKIGHTQVNVKTEAGEYISGRICVLRKSESQIKEAHRKLDRAASKKQKKIKPETYEFAKYIVVFSTFPSETFTPNTLLECYRLRWQIELVFKRLKSLMAIGHLPKKDPASSRAWLYGKLFLALLSDKLARVSRAFSPWGYHLPKPLARI